MNRKIFLPFLLLQIILLCCNCQKSEFPKTNQTCRRIISLSPSTTEILFALGLGDRVAGVTRFCNYPPEAQTKPKVGGYLDPNYEAIAILKPDIVILLPEHENVRNYLQELGINFLTVNNKKVDDIIQSIQTIGCLCGVKNKADSLITNIEQRIKAVKSKSTQTNKPKIMICIGRTAGAGTLEEVYIAGKNTFYDELVNISGGENAYSHSDITYPMLSAEGILSINPDIIIDLISKDDQNMLGASSILNDWQKLPQVNAVKNNKLNILSNDYVFIPGPRFIQLLEDLAKIIQ